MPTAVPVLLVSDDEKRTPGLIASLQEAGFAPAWIRDPQEALREPVGPYHIALIEIDAAGEHGLDMLRRLRAHSDLPVIVIASHDRAGDKVRALLLGADDHLTRPFSSEELIARMRARLRRPAIHREGVARHGGLHVDLQGRRVTLEEAAVDLTRAEFEILAALVRRPGEVVGRRWLAENVLDPERQGSQRTLDVHLSRLRKKLGAAAAQVTTVRGVGYRFDPLPKDQRPQRPRAR